MREVKHAKPAPAVAAAHRVGREVVCAAEAQARCNSAQHRMAMTYSTASKRFGVVRETNDMERGGADGGDCGT
jgi:hypothetical protein